MKPGIKVKVAERSLFPVLTLSVGIWTLIATWQFNSYGFSNPTRIFWIPLTLCSSYVVLFVLGLEVQDALTDEGRLENQTKFGGGKNRKPMISYLRWFSTVILVIVLSSLTYLAAHAVIFGFSRFTVSSGYSTEDSLFAFSFFYLGITVLEALFVIWRVIIAITSKNRELAWKHVRAQLLKNGGIIIPTLFAMFFYEFNSVDLINKNVLTAVFYPLFSVAIYFLVDTRIALNVQAKIVNKTKGISFQKGFVYSCVLIIVLVLFYPIYIFI